MDKALQKLAKKYDIERRGYQRAYGDAVVIRFRNKPDIKDDIDRYLWAYEKNLDVKHQLGKAILGENCRYPIIPPSEYELLMNQNIKLLTEVTSGSGFWKTIFQTWEPTVDISKNAAPVQPIALESSRASGS